jgi:hypothetical protein|tara:strand:- start:11767 stop:12000 length:234 start_codon:yes stop_codon:yes gene_type:complete
MGTIRQDENSERHPPIRSDRFFKLHNFWFFATREGAAVGPFDSKECADRAVGDFIEFAKQADEETLAFFIPGARQAG